MDWRKNRVAIGAATFFLLLGLTLWSVNRRNKPPSGSLEVPSIELDEAAITALEITRPEDERVVLSKAGDRWRVTEPLDAQADQGNVKTALNRLRDLEIARIVADRPENYERLQVDDANAVHVVVRAGEDTLAELKVGKYANGMTMLRLGERKEVYGASGSLRYAFDRELKVWRNRRVVEVEPATVESIRFDSGNGAFSFERQEDGWKPIEGKKALGDFDPKTVTSLVSTVTRLIATDFAPEDTSPARAGLNEPKATVTTRVSVSCATMASFRRADLAAFSDNR